MLFRSISVLAGLFMAANSLFAFSEIDSLAYGTPVLQLGAPAPMTSEDSVVYDALINEFAEVVHFSNGDTLVVIGRGKDYCSTCAFQIQQKRADWWTEFLYQHVNPVDLKSCHRCGLTLKSISFGVNWPIIPSPNSEAEEAMNRLTDVRLSKYKENALMDSLLGYEDLDPHLFGLEIGRSTLNQSKKILNAYGKDFSEGLSGKYVNDSVLVVDSVFLIIPWKKLILSYDDNSTLKELEFVMDLGMSKPYSEMSKPEKAVYADKCNEKGSLIKRYYSHFSNPVVEPLSPIYGNLWTNSKIEVFYNLASLTIRCAVYK